MSSTQHTMAFIALLLVSLVLGGLYLRLGFNAKAYLTSAAKQSDRSIGWLFWWSLDKKLYDPAGQELCRKGNLLVVPLLASYVAWYVLLVK